ncbi:hypothetical protein [Amycolatopsis regifaucium]|uniref:hypothetical protein n=1 Tax=Amycolatopsis regifaucium TaxID=546365 RepID=UPI001160B997|nr:hypothetical protein [Amycolatopsis regifaucium]
MRTSGPWEIVDCLCAWVRDTPWCDWLELGGSLAVGGGDEYSDVDAGLGVGDGIKLPEACAAVVEAAGRFAAVSDTLLQDVGASTAATHVIVQYEDGRQLSLVVLAGSDRPGVPPGARVLFDRTGRLKEKWLPSQLEASFDERREWAFLSWLNLGDAAKHGRRGKMWRAIHSLDQARDCGWKLHAAARGLDYPSFGLVSVQTAKCPPPPGIEESYPRGIESGSIRRAVLSLAPVLGPLTEGLSVGGVRAVTERNLSVGWTHE